MIFFLGIIIGIAVGLWISDQLSNFKIKKGKNGRGTK